MGLLTEKGVTLGTTKSSGGLLQQQGYKKITDIKPVTQVTPPTTQPISFAGKAPVSALFNPVTSPIPSKTVAKPTTGVFPTLQTKLSEKPYISPYPTEKPATISPAGETILKTVAKTGVSLLEQVTKGLDYTQDLIAKNLVHKEKPTLLSQIPGVINLNDKWLNWYTQRETKGELLTQKAQKFVDTLAKSDYVQNRPEWEALSLKEKLSKNNLGETVLNLVPSVLSSVALYAINPAVGFVASASSTAQDIKEDAIKNGVDEKKAERLALATGLTVGALDKIVPDEVFRNKEIKKLFLKDFMKNLVRRTITESGTEIAQEDIQMIAEQTYREISKDEKKTRQVMSALGGALGGAGFSILGDFANTTVQNDIMQTPPTKKTTVEEIKFTSPKTLAKEIGNSEPGGVKSVDKLSKTLEAKDDEIYRDRVEEYKQKIQNGEAIDPIVINENEEVLDGGHRLTAMKELGIKATETVVQKEKPVVEKPTPITEKVETNEALLAEARKYKSAEEFVKAQGTPVYHGSREKIDQFDLNHLNATYMHDGLGVNFTDKKDFAELYSRGKNQWGEINKVDDGLGYVNERFIAGGNALDVTSGKVKVADILSFEDFKKIAEKGSDSSLARQNLERVARNNFTGNMSSREITEKVSKMSTEELLRFRYNLLKNRPLTSGGGLPDLFRALLETHGVRDTDKTSVVKAFSEITGKDFIKTAKKDGSIVYTVLNPDKLQTKSQLTDIYNQAKGLTPEVKTYYRATADGKTLGDGQKWAWLDRETAQKWAEKNNAKVVEFTVPDSAIDSIDLQRIKNGTTDRFVFDTSKAKIITPEVKPKVAEKEIGVAREQLPLGEGKKKVSRLEARVNKISKKISNLDQETIDRLSLATYNQLNKKENITKAVKYARQNPEEALKVLTGEIEAPKGILRNAIYVVMQNEAIGDVELARKIASIGATRLGQEISILTEIDPNSPVKVMSDVIKIKEEAYNKRFGKQRKTEITEKSVNELKKSVKKPDKYDWQNFISQIQC